MTEPKEFQPLDELYKNAFENLPQTPATSGWDLPSDQVWANINTQITSSKSGWTLSTIAILSTICITVAVALYFTFRDTAVPAAPLTQPVISAPPVVQEEVAAPIVAPVQPEKAPVLANPKTKSQHTTTKAPNSTVVQPTAPATTRPKDGASHQLPGTTPQPPNSTEERKNSSKN